MKVIDGIKLVVGGIASGLAGYSAGRILENACPKTGDWKRDLALKAGCGLIGGLVASMVEEKVCKDVDDVEKSLSDIRGEVKKMKDEMLGTEEEKIERKYVTTVDATGKTLIASKSEDGKKLNLAVKPSYSQDTDGDVEANVVITTGTTEKEEDTEADENGDA